VSIGIGSGHGTITLAIHLKDLQPVPMIQVDSLVKEFHRPKRFDGPLGGLRTLVTQQHETTRAVDGVSFTVDEGELIGYLGSNGAGKSTTIKMLSGILVPTSGTVTVGGLVPWEQRERNALQIGVVFGQRTQLWWDLPLGDSLKLIGKLYRVDATRYQRNLERLVDLLGLDEFPTGQCANSAWGNECAATWRRPCSMSHACSTSMSPRSGSMWWRRSGCGSSSKMSTETPGPRSC